MISSTHASGLKLCIFDVQALVTVLWLGNRRFKAVRADDESFHVEATLIAHHVLPNSLSNPIVCVQSSPRSTAPNNGKASVPKGASGGTLSRRANARKTLSNAAKAPARELGQNNMVTFYTDDAPGLKV